MTKKISKGHGNTSNIKSYSTLWGLFTPYDVMCLSQQSFGRWPIASQYHSVTRTYVSWIPRHSPEGNSTGNSSFEASHCKWKKDYPRMMSIDMSGNVALYAPLWAKSWLLICNGPLVRYAKLRVSHAPGMPRVSDLDMNHDTWRGKRSRNSRHAQPVICVSG